MAWSFVGTSTTVEATATPLTLTEPAGVANGDLLIATISSRSTATTAPTATGWTAVASQNNNNTLTTTSAIGSGAMLYQIRSGTPTLAFTLPAGVSVAQGRITAYRGSAQTTPLDASTAATTATAVTAVSVTGLTTTSANDLIVAMTAGGQEATWASFTNVTTPLTASGAVDTTTAPSSTAWTKRAETTTVTGADTSLGVFDAVRTGTGATGNLTVTASLGAGHVVVAGAFKIAPPPTADAWNKNDVSANITLTASDKTATTTSGSSGGVRSTTTYTNGSAGKYYAEFVLQSTGASTQLGITPTSNTLIAQTSNFYVSPGAGGIIINSGGIGNVGGLVSGDVLSVAWDTGAERVWFRRNADNWNATGGHDPATGTGGLDASFAAATPHALWFSSAATAKIVTLRTKLAEYTQSIPDGFASWMGEKKATAVAGSYALTGADVTLTKGTTGPTAYNLPAVAGSYALTGAAAILKLGRLVTATGGSYSLTGSDTTLTKRVSYKLAADAGSYALSGAATTLLRTYRPTAVSGSYSLTGAVAALKHGWAAAAVSGSYSLSGTIATPKHGWKTAALSGSYALSGTIATLKHGYAPVAVSGSYSLTGTPANLKRGFKAAAVSGSYALSGATAALRHTYKATAVAGAYTLTGTPVNLLKPGAYAIIGLPGSYTLTGNAASLVKAGAPITPPVYSDIATVLYAPRTNTVVAKPAATVDGDILLVSLIIGKSGVSPGPVTPPAGWTRIGTRTAVNDGSFFANFYAFWKRASGEPANYTFVHASASTQAQIVAYSNCVPAGNPIDAYSVTFGNTNNNHVGDGEGNYWYDYASITTSIVKTKLVLLSHNWDGSGGLTAPSLTPFGTVLMTERFDNLVYSCDEDDTSVGATGIRTMRHLTAAPFGGYLIALKPADAPVAWFIQADPGGYGIAGADAVIGGGLIVLPGSYALTGAPVSLYYPSVPVVPPGSGQRDGDGGRAAAVRKRRRPQIFFIITQEAKKVVERPGPVRKKRKKIAKIIAEEVLPEAGGLLAADQLLLELMIRRQLEQIPLGDLHTEAWPRLQEMLMQVITDAEQTAQRLRAEAEEEDDLLLLLTS